MLHGGYDSVGLLGILALAEKHTWTILQERAQREDDLTAADRMKIRRRTGSRIFPGCENNDNRCQILTQRKKWRLIPLLLLNIGFQNALFLTLGDYDEDGVTRYTYEITDMVQMRLGRLADAAMKQSTNAPSDKILYTMNLTATVEGEKLSRKRLLSPPGHGRIGAEVTRS